MTLNYVWWWGSNSGYLRNEKYYVIVITPKSTFTWSGGNFQGPSKSEIDQLNIIRVR